MLSQTRQGQRQQLPHGTGRAPSDQWLHRSPAGNPNSATLKLPLGATDLQLFMKKTKDSERTFGPPPPLLPKIQTEKPVSGRSSQAAFASFELGMVSRGLQAGACWRDTPVSHCSQSLSDSFCQVCSTLLQPPANHAFSGLKSKTPFLLCPKMAYPPHVPRCLQNCCAYVNSLSTGIKTLIFVLLIRLLAQFRRI